MAPGGDDPGRHADQDRDEGGQRGEEQRRLGAVEDRLDDRAPEEDRLPEVALEEPPVPAPELDQQGLVEAQLAAQASHVLGRRVGPGDHARGVAGRQVHQDERHRRHHQHHGAERQEPPREVGLHGSGARTASEG